MACLAVLIHTPPEQTSDKPDECAGRILRLVAHQDLAVAAPATLALASSGWRGAGEMLLHILGDSVEGRGACRRAHVPLELRRAAAAGVAMLLRTDPATAGMARVQGLAAALLDGESSLAAVAARGLANLGNGPFRAAALDALEACFDGRRTPAANRAHALQAAAALIGPGDASPARNRWKLRCRAALHEPGLAAAAALALGRLCTPVDDRSAPDAPIAHELMQRYRQAADEPTRVFCLLGLGLMGGAQVCSELLEVFRRPLIPRQKAWAALALGIEGHARRRRSKSQEQPLVPNPVVGDALRDALARAAEDELRCALLISLGLHGERTQGSQTLRDLVRDDQTPDSVRAAATLALGLMNDGRSIGDLRTTMETAVRRAPLLRTTAVSLALLGDKQVNESLRDQLAKAEPSLARQVVILDALGLVSDRRDIEPLLDMANDERLAMPLRVRALQALAQLVAPADSHWTAHGPWVDAAPVLGAPLDGVLHGF